MTPIERLKIQYKETKKEADRIIQTLRVSSYTGMRNLCIDCSLVSFAEIEEMEEEVNNLKN